MPTFEFSTTVVDKVIQELEEASEYIRIAVFQIHDEKIFTALQEKLSQGVLVEIITLPYDSINDDVREKVSGFFQELEKAGAKLLFCEWNVGDPERTSTATGRWYSFHAKFIVTDKCAIALSANLTEERELDAAISYKSDSVKIDESYSKFGELQSRFINNDAGYDGSIRREIMNTGLSESDPIFSAPSGIQGSALREHWINDYPSSLCPEGIRAQERLYLSPFDCRARDFLESVATKSTNFVYLSAESFTDPQFANFLKKLALTGLEIRVITGTRSMDFTDRIQREFRKLLAHGIQLRTTEAPLHAKLLLTDNHLLVSSVNLNRMNLGFAKTAKNWRANTESIATCCDQAILNEAKKDYLSVFDSALDVESKLAEKIEDTIKTVFY